MAQRVYTVRQINHYIRQMFTQDFLLTRLSIQGEVSNCKYHTSGHIYFSLKDESASIACVMFAGQRKGLAFPMKNGDQVVVSGSVNVYERDGRYQFYAQEIRSAGSGLLYERFLQLKRELEEMGMFASEYKQPIPKGIRTLGVVTAPTGAAIRDICSVAKRRNPGIQIILYPALVQGDGAAESIVRGIHILAHAGIETMIVGRGGGSLEDLWAFNEEIVARAIFECPVPVISAVGHETDVTIADFVADLRAPTPSAAAELAVDDVAAIQLRLDNYGKRIRQMMQTEISLRRQRLLRCSAQIRYLSPQQQISEKRQFLADTQDQLSRGMERQMAEERQVLQEMERDLAAGMDRRLLREKTHCLMLIERLKGLSPLDKLKQGYSYTEKEDGRAVTGIAQVREGELLRIHVRDGRIMARVAGTSGVMGWISGQGSPQSDGKDSPGTAAGEGEG